MLQHVLRRGRILRSIVIRSYSSQYTSIESQYEEKKRIYNSSASRAVSNSTVFCNMEMSLKYTSVYGFDFDFTLIQYTSEVLKLLYDESKKRMADKLSYPSDIKNMKYNPDFVIRGLHLDIRNGLLMKMDAYHHIQLGSVYRGHESLSSDEVVDIYKGTHVPLYIMDDHMHREGNPRNLVHFLDSFSIPEVALFADISDYLYKHNIPFDPEYLYMDVESTIKEVHTSEVIHKTIITDPDRYIEDISDVAKFLNLLKTSGKTLFLLTNSPFWFVDKGMRHVTKSNDWRELFDVIVCSARKPTFYSEVNRPFRSINLDTLVPTWEKATQLKHGTECVYHQGNIKEFIELTDWNGSDVLYIGDHVYSDLTDPTLHLGWKTVAIIPELETEIIKSNCKSYKENLASLLALESVLNENQDSEIEQQWKRKRADLRKILKNIYNPYFGSIFRTERGPTYFSRRLMRFASLYTSSVSNFLNLSLNHTFYSRRSSLPHEPDINFDS